MLTNIRQAIFSTPGKIIALLLLVALAIGFAMMDIQGLTGGSSGGANGALVEVGNRKLSEQELQDRLKAALERQREQQPTLDMATFVRNGGYDQVLNSLIDFMAVEEYAKEHGMAISKSAVDAQIAAAPAFQGFDGKFSQQRFDLFLQEQRLTADQIRADISRQALIEWITTPVLNPGPVPSEVATSYASLLLERRAGSVGFVRSTAMNAGAAPTAAEVDAYYRNNAARYTVPERRVLRYTVISADAFAQSATVSDAEIAAEYKREASKYAAVTRRNVSQVIVADEAAAKALAAKVNAGTPIGEAAKAAGLQAAVVKGVEKAALTRSTNAAIANAVFAAKQGDVIGPVRAPLGWYIGKVDSIEQVAGKTMDQVRGELAKVVIQRKLVEHRAQIDGVISDNATFDELLAEAKLKGETTPAIFANGRVDGDTSETPNALFVELAKAGFTMETNDDPQVITIGEDGSFAVVKTERVVPAAPRPLKDIQAIVTADLTLSRQLAAARTAANAIMAKVNKGMSLAQAMKESGHNLEAPQSINALRGQVSQLGDQVPPPVRLLFAMQKGKARVIPAPQSGGYWVVVLDNVEAGNAKGNAAAIAATRGELVRMVGDEYGQQFALAARRAMKVKRNEAAIARVKAQLSGQTSDGN